MLRNFRFSVSTCIRNSGILNYRSEIINRTLLVKSPPRAWLSTSQQLKQKKFVFSTKIKKITIHLKDEDNGSTYLKISELASEARRRRHGSSVYVDKSALKTFISSIELVAKQKERVTFPSGSYNGKNISMEYYGGRHMS